MPKKSPKDWSPRGEFPGAPIWPDFVDAYLEAALWTGVDGQGLPLDQHYSVEDFSELAVMRAIEESNDFIKANLDDLAAVGTPPQHGHDFWLTRNHHGAGYWDRGYGEIGKRLTDAAHSFGELFVYAGDDGKLHLEGG